MPQKSLNQNQQVMGEEVKTGKNRGKLYAMPNKVWGDVVIEARLTGYRGNVQDDVKLLTEELEDKQVERQISASLREMVIFFILKKQHKKVCEELVQLKDMLELKTKECQTYQSKVESLGRKFK